MTHAQRRPQSAVRGPIARLSDIEQRYSAGRNRPLGSYALLATTYSAWATGLVTFARRKRTGPYPSLGATDLALLTVAVFRLSRLITKDSITAFLRAPFSRFEGQSGPGEVHEEVIGTGLPHAVGELVTCPFCLSVWIATTLAFGMTVFPRPTRRACTVLAAVAGADVLQFVYSAIEQSAQ